jgi:hypothetical protein
MSFGVAAIVFWYLVTETFIYLTDSNGIEYMNWDKMITKWSSIDLYGYGVLSEPTASIDYTTAGIPMKILMSTVHILMRYKSVVMIGCQILVLISCLSAHEISRKVFQKVTDGANGIPEKLMVLVTSIIRLSDHIQFKDICMKIKSIL